MNFLKRFKAAIGFVLLLITVFWVPKNVLEWEQAAEPWGEVFSMVDQNTALWAFAVVALLYILWIDARPFVHRWRDQRRSPALSIEFPNGINRISSYGANKQSTSYLTKTGSDGPMTVMNYYFGAQNNSEKTIRNVHAIVQEIRNPIGSQPHALLPNSGGSGYADVAPGGTALILAGVRYVHGWEAERVAFVDEGKFRELNAHWDDHKSFVMRFLNGHSAEFRKNDNSYFVVGIYGDDIAPQDHLFAVNGKDPFEILHLGRINADEDIPTRLRLGIAKETLRETRPG